MRKILLLTLCSVLISVATATAAETLKIGFVDLPRIFLESEAGKKARADIEAIEKSKKAVIEEKVNALKKIEEEVTKQSSVLSAEAKKAKEEEFEKLQRDIQKLVAEAQAELQKKGDELTNAILKDVSDIVDAVGHEEGYAVIFRSEVVLSAKKELDLTDLIMKRLNESRGKPKEEPKVKPKEKPKDKKSRNKD
ncbi:MAG: OmpH family outer membrane protein [Thermodesulfovibrionales bacterium]|nr:OmpH family outer membrane protein [Nitrospinota bacterium]MDP3049001.1 OmpH family outer membrane protein [Thermodesulfovibrionales bacterium]